MSESYAKLAARCEVVAARRCPSDKVKAEVAVSVEMQGAPQLTIEKRNGRCRIEPLPESWNGTDMPVN